MLGRLLRAVRERKHEPIAKIETGLPSSIGFSSRAEAPAAQTFGEVWLVGTLALRGDVAFWLRVLDTATRRELGEFVQSHRAKLHDGILELHDVTPPTIRSATALATRLREALGSSDDTALFAACKHGRLRERLVAVTFLRTKRADDPSANGLLAELDASTDPAVQMLADLAAARWAKIAGHADNTRFDEPLLAEAVETLRALYPRIEVTGASPRVQLKAICTALSGG
jgi:hypothetical protein